MICEPHPGVDRFVMAGITVIVGVCTIFHHVFVFKHGNAKAVALMSRYFSLSPG